MQYILAVFLDIEETFDNVSTKVIMKALTRIVVKLISRKIQSDLRDNHLATAVGRRIPQGGTIFPALWLIIMDKILQKLDRSRLKTVEHTNGFVMLVSGILWVKLWNCAG